MLEICAQRLVGFVELLLLHGQFIHLDLQLRIRVDELAIELLGVAREMLIRLEQMVALHGILHGGEQLGAHPRLGDKAKNFPLIDRAHQGVQRQHAGEQDARGIRVQAARVAHQLQPAHAGHALIGDDHRKAARPQDAERFVTGGTRHHFIAFPGQLLAQRVEDVRLVVDDQHRSFARSLHDQLSAQSSALPAPKRP